MIFTAKDLLFLLVFCSNWCPVTMRLPHTVSKFKKPQAAWSRKWRHFNTSSVSVLLSDMCTSYPQGMERRVVISCYSNTCNVYFMLASDDYVFCSGRIS